jgi:hypothetical protein
VAGLVERYNTFWRIGPNASNSEEACQVMQSAKAA